MIYNISTRVSQPEARVDYYMDSELRDNKIEIGRFSRKKSHENVEEIRIFEHGLSNAKSKRKIGKKIEARNEKIFL